MPRIGVYICHCGINIAATVDVEEVRRFAETLEDVVVARDYLYTCSDPGQEMIIEDIKEYKLDRVVVASCSPRMHEPTFRAAIEEAGLNPFCLEMANIREHCSWVHKDKEKATQKAKDLVAAAVAKARLLEPLELRKVAVTPAALVIGGGVAGIYAALEIAEKGFKVYLVEKSPTIGGIMAYLDKTFPTLDCSICILAPKMVEVARHPNIELLTYSEIEEVKGYAGDFIVKVRKKARFIDEDKCRGCGICAQVCRKKKVVNEYNWGIGYRRAAYIPFPQAVPMVYVIDPENCFYLTKGKCGKQPKCIEECPTGAINFEQKDEIVELNVGAIVVATGFDLYEPELVNQFDEVITVMQLERLSVASGPTGGKIEINGKEPKKVVFIQCVGSREKDGRSYCSRVCCMITAKQAHIVKERIPDAEVVVLYNDVRAYGKGFEEFYNRVKKEGVKYIRRELDAPIEVFKENGKLKIKAETVEGLYEDEVDLIVLANAFIPSKGTKELAEKLGVLLDKHGFFREIHPKFKPFESSFDGIYFAGCCVSPKDIPDTVAQAMGAAAKVVAFLSGEKVVKPNVAVVFENACRGCGTCVSVCPFHAATLQPKNGKKVAKIDEFLCKGCGICVASCLSGAIKQVNYDDRQLISQIEVIAWAK